jgi:hypothetical protein
MLSATSASAVVSSAGADFVPRQTVFEQGDRG